jgi:hypothetical protein
LDLLTFFTNFPNALDKDSGREIAAAWSVEYVEKGRRIATQGEPDLLEHIILEGRATSLITDPESRAVCVGFHAGPCVVAPNVARTRNRTSLVSIEVIADALVARMDSRALTELMLASEPIREWANGILQQELARKAEREWCLAALGGCMVSESFPASRRAFRSLFDSIFSRNHTGHTQSASQCQARHGC